jgi:hypothetical protein
MASITEEGNGRRTTPFVGLDRIRHSLRLGKVTKDTAVSVKGYVQRLLGALKQNVPIDSLTAAWLGKLDDTTHAKLADFGLVAPRPRPEPLEDSTDCDLAEYEISDPRLLAGMLNTFKAPRLKGKRTHATESAHVFRRPQATLH